MKYTFLVKLTFFSLLNLMVLCCQNQTTSNSFNKTNSNVPLNNANGANQANQSNGETPVSQKINFESADKVQIVGTFYESPQTNSPAVLLLHQFGSSRKSYDDFAKRLQQQNFGVLAIDGRGFGESTKTADGKTIVQNPEAESLDAETVKRMKADVAGAFEYLSKQKNVDAGRIGIVGASYGSSLAIIYAAENPRVKAVALLSPGLNYFGSMPTEPAVKSYAPRPLLMIAADDDKESADSVKKLKAADEKSEAKIYLKGGHGTGLFEAKVGLEDLLEQFLTKSL